MTAIGATRAREGLLQARAQRSARTAALVAAIPGATDPQERAALRDELVTINRGVAESVALRYRDRGIATEDLVQVACIGLIHAVHRFDPDRAEDLLTYAVPMIRGEIQRHFRDHGWMVRPTRRVQDLRLRVNRASGELGQRLGRQPTAAEVCEELGITPADHEEAMAAGGCFQPLSLDQPAAADGADVTGSWVGEDQALDAVEARTVLEPVLRELSQRDRRILRLRYVEERSQSEIGDELGVTQAQVSRLLTRILTDLRLRIDGGVRTSRPPGRVTRGGTARGRAALDDLTGHLA